MKDTKNIVIVGAGTAGLTTALILKQYFPHYIITVIKSPQVEIIGVGEGSTEHWQSFIDFVGINHIELINETDATIKIGILFKDWNFLGSEYVHSILSDPSYSEWGTLDKFNLSLLRSQEKFPLSEGFENTYYQNKLPLGKDLKVSNQYHFDTFKLNSYLTKKCEERNIKFETAHIANVNLDNDGNINNITSKDGFFIKGDFFIDCSGFKRILSTSLGTKWVSYKDYLPVNQAITFPTELNIKNGIEPYTKATALQNGWTWKIPTQTRYGNGYVFSNDYTTPDSALNELNHHLGVNVERVAKNIKFEAGKVDKFWFKNCVNIGLAGSFAEPLEAQSIGFSLIQALLLGKYLHSWLIDPNISYSYNKIIDQSYNNIVDYVQIHYLNKRNDSKFWKEKPLKITEFNKSTFNRFSYGIYTPNDFPNPKYTMFKEANFYQVYQGLGIISTEKIHSTHLNLPKDHQTFIEGVYTKFTNLPLPLTITHLDYLKLVKENHSF